MDEFKDKYRKLADAIILQAVKDYREALEQKRWGSVRMIERFFRSELFNNLTKLNPEMLITRLRAEVKRNDS